MRARPDAGVVAIAPVGQVVPALAARHARSSTPRRPAGRSARLPPPSPGTARRRGLRPAARSRRAGAAPRTACRLDGELVQRQMVRRQRQRLAQLGPPAPQRLAGPGVDQVERHAREDRARRSPAPRSPAPPNAAGRACAALPDRGSARRSRPGSRRRRGTRRSAPASTLVGIGLQRDLDIVAPASNSAPASSISAATVSGSIRLGVPPPKKIEVSRRRPSRSASHASSRRSAARKRACGMRSRTCELKSQYGHLARQNGQWI